MAASCATFFFRIAESGHSRAPKPLLACLAAAIVAAFFYELANKLRGTLLITGALSMGLFAVAGTDKAMLSGLAWVPVILLGTITAIGGSVVQSMLLDEVPGVLKPGTLTASAAVAGAATYVLLVEWLGIVKPVAMTACVVIVVGLRLLSIKLGWESPTPERSDRQDGRAAENAPALGPTQGIRRLKGLGRANAPARPTSAESRPAPDPEHPRG